MLNKKNRDWIRYELLRIAVLISILAITTRTSAQPIGSESPEAKARQPSFDCRLARSKTERLICSSPELAALDRQLSNAYREIGGSSGPQVNEQRRWIGKLNDCSTTPCLTERYRQRITELEVARANALVSTPPRSDFNGLASNAPLPAQPSSPDNATPQTREQCLALRWTNDGRGENMAQVNDCLRSIAATRHEASHREHERLELERQEKEEALRVAETEQRRQATLAIQQREQEQEAQQRELREREEGRAADEKARQERQVAESQANEEQRFKKGKEAAILSQRDKVVSMDYPERFLDSKIMVARFGGYDNAGTLRTFLSLLFQSGEYTNISTWQGETPDIWGISLKKAGLPTDTLVWKQDGDELYMYGYGQGGIVNRRDSGDIGLSIQFRGLYNRLLESAASRVD